MAKRAQQELALQRVCDTYGKTGTMFYLENIVKAVSNKVYDG
jgi:hypothetical protein